jgi:hypothetical protein
MIAIFKVEVGFPLLLKGACRCTFPMRRFSARLRAAPGTESLPGLSGQPTHAQASGTLHVALCSGGSARVARNPGILVKVPRDAAATNFSVRIDLETETRL